MPYFLLHYDLTNDYLERRPGFRSEHLDLARAYAERAQLRYGGALANPADSALLIFEVPDESVIRGFVEADPYVRNGLVKSWQIREWTVVVGADHDGTNPVSRDEPIEPDSK